MADTTEKPRTVTLLLDEQAGTDICVGMALALALVSDTASVVTLLIRAPEPIQVLLCGLLSQLANGETDNIKAARSIAARSNALITLLKQIDETLSKEVR